jgi:putative transcriptional regulator
MKILISNRIRRLRFESGEMTQQELARRSGCTRQTINAIEAAKYGPSLELAFKIAEVFGVGIEEVFQYAVVSRANGASDRTQP